MASKIGSIIRTVGPMLKADEVIIDNVIARLHYRFTLAILMLFSVILALQQNTTNVIYCNPIDGVSQDVVNEFCRIHSTFSVAEAWNKHVGVEVPYPGIDMYVPGAERVEHTYYKWVSYMLLAQAILFYLPRYFWTVVDDGLLKALVSQINTKNKDSKKDEDSRKSGASKKKGKSYLGIRRYLMLRMGTHNSYIFSHLACEFLSFTNIIFQIYMLDSFLGGKFLTYGIKILGYRGWDDSPGYDPIVPIFPRLTKCMYLKFSRSGGIDRRNTMCLLPLNVVNEKIYVFLWFWFILLAFLTAFSLTLSSFTVVSQRVRVKLLSLKVGSSLANRTCRMIKKRGGGPSDWFFLYQLSRNFQRYKFCKILKTLLDEDAEGEQEDANDGKTESSKSYSHPEKSVPV